MRKFFLQAGGVDSRVLELYADIGHQHLVPAYAKHISGVGYSITIIIDVKLVHAIGRCGLLYCLSLQVLLPRAENTIRRTS